MGVGSKVWQVNSTMNPLPLCARACALQNDPSGSRDNRVSKGSSVLIGVSDAAQGCPKFTALVNHLVKSLFINLTEKSNSYPTVSKS